MYFSNHVQIWSLSGHWISGVGHKFCRRDLDLYTPFLSGASLCVWQEPPKLVTHAAKTCLSVDLVSDTDFFFVDLQPKHVLVLGVSTLVCIRKWAWISDTSGCQQILNRSSCPVSSAHYIAAWCRPRSNKFLSYKWRWHFNPHPKTITGIKSHKCLVTLLSLNILVLWHHYAKSSFCSHKL